MTWRTISAEEFAECLSGQKIVSTRSEYGYVSNCDGYPTVFVLENGNELCVGG